jgi:AbrB family looped-hinge helix DNA binding protein
MKENQEYKECQRRFAMNLAKVSANGQVTVPIEIRKKLRLRGGDKLLFLERRNGEVVIDNASAAALARAQAAFKNAAGDFGVDSEEGIQELVNAVRYGKKGKG